MISTSTTIGFDFLNFDLEYLKTLQSSELLHTKMPTTSASSAHGLYRILSSYLFGQFYWMKKSAKVLHYFGLDCGMLEFFKYCTTYSRAILQRAIVDSSILEPGLTEKVMI
jgi:hypothetical protein